MERRPIASRDTNWARAAARLLRQAGATPNLISVMGPVFALIGGACFFPAFQVDSWARSVLLIGGAAMIQLRLVCNLLDGMVAIEGGMKTPCGDICNDLPDRISDSFIILGIAYGLTGVSHGAELGWAAALTAMLTAYIRVLGGSCGVKQKFTGPMAKQHRMALLTLAAVIAAFLPPSYAQHVLAAALLVIIAGSMLTCVVRLRGVCRDLSEAAGSKRDTPQ